MPWEGTTIKRGQVVTSYQNLASDTGLTVQQTRNSIKKLKSTGEITSQSTNKYTIVTLVNYEDYQCSDEIETSKTTSNSTNEQQTSNKQTTNKQQQRNNDKNNKNILCAFFDELWELYPEKKGKTKVTQKALTEIEKIGFEKMVQCIKRYKRDKPEWQNWKNGSTFFNSGYIDYLDENYTEDAPEKTQTIEELWGEFGAK